MLTAILFRLDTGAITTALRGLALAAIVVFVMFFVLTWAPVVCAICWTGCCSLAPVFGWTALACVGMLLLPRVTRFA